MDFSPVSAFVTAVPFDWLIIGLTFFLITVATMILGPHYGTALSLSLPISAFLFSLMGHTTPLSEIAAQFASPVARIVMFAIILVIVCVCIYRIVSSLFSPSAYPLQALVIGFETTVSLTVFFVQQPLADLPWWHFGPQVQAIFGNAFALWWLLAAYVGFDFVSA